MQRISNGEVILTDVEKVVSDLFDSYRTRGVRTPTAIAWCKQAADSRLNLSDEFWEYLGSDQTNQPTDTPTTEPTNTNNKENTDMSTNTSHDRIRDLVQSIRDDLLREREREHVEAVTAIYTEMVESAEVGDVIRCMTDGDTPDVIWWGLHTDGKWYRFDYTRNATDAEYLISDLVARAFDGTIIKMVPGETVTEVEPF